MHIFSCALKWQKYQLQIEFQSFSINTDPFFQLAESLHQQSLENMTKMQSFPPGQGPWTEPKNISMFNIPSKNHLSKSCLFFISLKQNLVFFLIGDQSGKNSPLALLCFKLLILFLTDQSISCWYYDGRDNHAILDED